MTALHNNPALAASAPAPIAYIAPGSTIANDDAPHAAENPRRASRKRAADSSAEGDPKRERAIAARLSAIGIGGNIVLAAFKLFAGIFGNSAAMVSDAVHSLSDVFATAIAYIGVRVSKRPADASHPYGHERFECLASLALGIILLATGLGIGYASVDAIASRSYLNTAAPGIIALIAAVVSIVVKEAMFWYTRHWARVLDSSAFLADAWHHRSDALSSIGALLGIGGAIAGFPICDPLASAVICAVILKVAYDVLKDAVNKMLDTPCSPEFEREVKDCIAAEEGIVRIDALRTRQFGNRAYVDVEIAVAGNMSLTCAHGIAHAAHDAVERTFPNVKHVMIHVNPA